MGIKILNSDRVAFLGSTGSGKTQLAKFFLEKLNRVVVIDPKHTFKLDGFKKGWTPPSFKNDFKLIVRPKRSEDERLDELFLKLFKMGNVTIYCDEMATLSDFFPESTRTLEDIARTGREKRVALWSAMQRPRGCPKVFLTESEVFFCFNLRAEEDRKYVQTFAGDEATHSKVKKFSFWYIRTDEESPGLFTLNLNKNTVERSQQ